MNCLMLKMKNQRKAALWEVEIQIINVEICITHSNRKKIDIYYLIRKIKSLIKYFKNLKKFKIVPMNLRINKIILG